jgi:AraC-like DNA-binding protein
MSNQEKPTIQSEEKKVGRPKLDIDAEQVKRLARLHCTMQEMADFFGCHRDTLHNNFSAEIDKGRSEGNISLRRKQWQMAVEKGNVVMLIWLGKQMLGQRNEIIESDNNTPLPIYDIVENKTEVIEMKVEDGK